MTLLQSAPVERDRFVSHLYQARREYRLVCERAGKGGKQIERCVIARFQIAENIDANCPARAGPERAGRIRSYPSLEIDSIEKWINEHGSAAILRDRIELAKELHASMERKVAGLTRELEGSKAKIEQFERENRDLRGIVPYQQQTIEEYERHSEGPALPPCGWNT
jgi:hypothetical protein